MSNTSYTRAVIIAFGLVLGAYIASIAISYAQQEKPKKGGAVITFELMGVEPHEENDLFMRVDTVSGAHLIRVSSISGFSFYPKEDLLRNAIYVGAGKIETTATEEELRAAIKDSEDLIRSLKKDPPPKSGR